MEDSIMRNPLLLFCLFLIGAMTLGGCKPAEKSASNVPANNAGVVKPVSAVLCGKCGHEKGSAICCSDDCATCDKCQLHVGSALCCKVAEDVRGKDMCTACGHIASGGECCKDGCTICAKCGLHKGSPLCCKLTTDADTPDEEGSDQPSDS